MNAYKFHSDYGSHTKTFKTDDEAFAYKNELTDDASCPPIHKLKGHDWFVWDIKGEQWVYDQKETDRSRKEAKRNFALDFGNG